MFVRMKTGAYAGQVREVAFDAARRLLDSGDAEEPEAESRPKSAPIAASSKPAAEEPKPKSKAKGGKK